MAENDADIDDVVNQHKDETEGGRAGAEAPAEQEPDDADDDEPQSLEDAVAGAYEQIDDGDLSSNLTLRDTDLAALFHGLETMDQLPDVGDAAADELNRDDEDTDTRAAVLRLLVRIGLKAVDEDVIQAGITGRNQYNTSDEL